MSGMRLHSQPLDRPIRLAVLISGGGTTLENFLRKIEEGELNATVCTVIASRENCGGVSKCRQAGLPCEVVAREEFQNAEDFSRVIFDICRSAEADLVLMAGFLSRLRIPEDFRWRVMNIHPALIPAFCGAGYYGEKVHQAVLDRGVKVSGCTVHFADNEYDQGPIIVQKCVPVLDHDTVKTLATRVFAAECEAYPEAVRLHAAGRLAEKVGRVQIITADDVGNG